MTRRHSGSRFTSLVCAALLALSVNACSFLFSHAPPEGHERMEYFTCTEGNAAPIIDVIWASLNVLTALAVAGNPDDYYLPNEQIGFSVAMALLSGAAAPVGFNKSKRCRAAKRQQAERQAQDRAPATERRPDGPVQPVTPQVAQPGVQAVVLNPQTDTLPVGARLQLVATAHGSSGATIPNATFAWSSSNDAVASVSSAGLITAHAPGAVVITANATNVVGTANMVIVPRR